MRVIRFDRINVSNLTNAIYGMRHPLESYDKSDSFKCPERCQGKGWNCHNCDLENDIGIGENDKSLALKLIQAGTDHSKFMRQIFISVDVTAPLYWWKEMDQYRVGCTTNSTSTMHTLTKKRLTEDNFSWDILTPTRKANLRHFNELIISWGMYKKSKMDDLAKEVWRELIQDLPSSFNQTRTWTANYQVLRNIYHARENHKLDEWKEFCKWIEELPYSEFITC